MTRPVSRTPTASPVAANLKAAQESKGFTNEALARKANVSLRLLLKYRAGDVQPRYENLCRLAFALDKPVEFFYMSEAEAA